MSDTKSYVKNLYIHSKFGDCIEFHESLPKSENYVLCVEYIAWKRTTQQQKNQEQTTSTGATAKKSSCTLVIILGKEEIVDKIDTTIVVNLKICFTIWSLKGK